MNGPGGMVLDGNAVRSVDRAAALLLALGESQGEAGVTELARRLGLHKSTASRLLATLQKRGLVEQDDETGKYRLGLAEVNLGLSPGMGGTQRLPRLIPKSRALHMMVTGDPVGPDQALQAGIVDRVIPEENLVEETMSHARKLAGGPTMAQGYIKLSVNMGLEMSLAEGLALERAHQNQLFASEDVAEGLKAFLEKRPPKYQGR